jgi:hypothetical protein
MRSFLERLVFPYLVYDRDHSTLFPRKIPTAFIHTMGADEKSAKAMGFDGPIRLVELVLGRIFGSSETLVATDTLQFDDYEKYVSSGHNPAEKARRHREVFPEDCRKAYDLGMRMAQAGRPPRDEKESKSH